MPMTTGPGKRSAGNPHSAFDEGEGVIPLSTLPLPPVFVLKFCHYLGEYFFHRRERRSRRVKKVYIKK